MDVVVAGGGPAGAAVGRLLAAWGHSVLVVDKPGDRMRGLAESIPPSTQKLLAEIGVRDAIDRAGFCRTRGNTVWWASRDRRVESFGPAPHAHGYQVYRPDFDRVLLECAADAGAQIASPARVHRVTFDDEGARVEFDGVKPRNAQPVAKLGSDAAATSVACRFVADCSGRTSIVGRQYRKAERHHRTYALVGVWQKRDGWDLPDETHTVVETYDEGWAWSVPISATVRHAGAMVGEVSGETPGRTPLTIAGSRALGLRYRIEIAKTRQLRRMFERASLQHVWACDASLYSAERYAGPGFVLVGDAGSFIDPLSSFGVKKALASAWLAAIVLHTCLTRPERAQMALDFFSSWERQVYVSHLRRSRDFARAAQVEHRHRFWTSRADVDVPAEDAPEDPDDGALMRDPSVQRAFERFKRAASINLVLADHVRFEQRPVIRGHEIVLEDALAGGMRYLHNVDLMQLATMACQHRQVPDLFDAYCRTCAPAPLPHVVGGLSLLVAKGILHERT